MNQQTQKDRPKLCEKTRGQFRNLVVTLEAELAKIYLDDENNLCFNGEYLDETFDLRKS